MRVVTGSWWHSWRTWRWHISRRRFWCRRVPSAWGAVRFLLLAFWPRRTLRRWLRKSATVPALCIRGLGALLAIPAFVLSIIWHRSPAVPVEREEGPSSDISRVIKNKYLSFGLHPLQTSFFRRLIHSPAFTFALSAPVSNQSIVVFVQTVPIFVVFGIKSIQLDLHFVVFRFHCGFKVAQPEGEFF